MGMDRAAARARAVPAETSGSEAGLTLAALIDVLDGADELLVRTRPRPRRGALHRSAAARTVADRWDPLRDQGSRSASTGVRARGTSRAVLRPTGTDRPVPRVVRARALPLRSIPPAPPARIPVVPAVAASPAAPARQPGAPARPPLRARLRAALAAVVRRAALWGAGPEGTRLAWSAPAPRRLDPPVVLRELPSTPTAAPAPRPARAAGPVTAGAARPAVRRTPARALRTPALSTVRRIPPLPRTTGAVPSRARSPGGVRGSPGSTSARGSPPWEAARTSEARRTPPSALPPRTVRTGTGSPPSPRGS